MMNDREMLELAAKAAGIPIVWPSSGPAMACRKLDGMDLWNPLEDDGDALRLMVALGIRAEPVGSYCVTYAGSVCAEQFTERSGDDEPAAMRRAIVRAATALGAAAGKA